MDFRNIRYNPEATWNAKKTTDGRIATNYRNRLIRYQNRGTENRYLLHYYLLKNSFRYFQLKTATENIDTHFSRENNIFWIKILNIFFQVS